MIIDFHTHFYPEKIRPRAMASVNGMLTPASDGGRQGLLDNMAKNHIDFSVGLPLVNTPRNARGVNAWAVMENHGAVRMLGSVHPEDPRWRDTLDFIARNGLPGIKVHPEYQLFKFSDERFFPVWERCEELGLFVLTHAGADLSFPPPAKTDPEQLAAFHRRFPELKLVLAHMGGFQMWDDVEKHLAGLPVWMDTAMMDDRMLSPEQMLRIIRKHGSDRILFGSDSPWQEPGRTLDFLRSLPLAPEEWRNITGNNAAKLLKLEGLPSMRNSPGTLPHPR